MAHGAVASKAFRNRALVDAAIDNWRGAPLEPKVRAMIAFLEKLTFSPDDVTSADIWPLRQAGLNDDAIEDAIHVCVLFNVYDRLADSFKFEIPDEAGFAMSANMLLKRGYV
jgi:uncharacterized peroxidase-related enzyme